MIAGVLTVAALRRILADPSLPGDLPVVSWRTDFSGAVEGVQVVAITKATRGQQGGLFVGQDAVTSGLDAVEVERVLFDAEEAEEPGNEPP